LFLKPAADHQGVSLAGPHNRRFRAVWSSCFTARAFARSRAGPFAYWTGSDWTKWGRPWVIVATSQAKPSQLKQRTLKVTFRLPRSTPP